MLNHTRHQLTIYNCAPLFGHWYTGFASDTGAAWRPQARGLHAAAAGAAPHPAAASLHHAAGHLTGLHLSCL